ESNNEANPVVAGVAGHDAVVVVRVPLDFAERLLSAGGAAAEVSMFGETSLVAADHQLGRLGHDMDRAVGPVQDLLRVSLAEVHLVARVTRVRTDRRVPARESGGHLCVSNRPGK